MSLGLTNKASLARTRFSGFRWSRAYLRAAVTNVEAADTNSADVLSTGDSAYFIRRQSSSMSRSCMKLHAG